MEIARRTVRRTFHYRHMIVLTNMLSVKIVRDAAMSFTKKIKPQDLDVTNVEIEDATGFY